MSSLGIDIGALYIKMVIVDDEGGIKKSVYESHKGNPIGTIKYGVKGMGIPGAACIGITGVHAGLLADQINTRPVDAIKAEIRGVREFCPEVRNIINIGGGSVTMIELDDGGEFSNYSTNSLCAAGTGSFLDVQAERLGIRYEELEKFPDIDSPPSIATRCSVFAKTDMINRQQEGYSREEIWAGLCQGMTHTCLQTLLSGRPLKGFTILTGGVSLNHEIMRCLNDRYKDEITTFKDAHLSGALGAAILSMDNETGRSGGVNWEGLSEGTGKGLSATDLRPLKLTRSEYPDFNVAESYSDKLDNEVRITCWPEDGEVRAYLGIDIGSTSTKLILIDEKGGVLADVYRKTLGDPIDATKKLFIAVQDFVKARGGRLTIIGCGTTGSGRKLVGTLIGADAVINEITSHAAGAMHIDPEIDTIFEIGGQDSKYIRTKGGYIHDSNMNYVCAAGTGSFVEEQAKKLSFEVSEIGDMVEGITPPRTSDRCTVFMENDIHRLIRQGFSKKDVIAAVMYSVVQNYLNKVVVNRYYSPKKIFFQGATARNKGLVAAFENLLGVEIVVSPYCHQMGAFGVALLTKDVMQKIHGGSKFKGLDLSRRRIELSNEVCDLCSNECKITCAGIEGESEVPSWGYMCGREPEDKIKKKPEEFKLFKKRQKLMLSTGGGADVKEDAPLSGSTDATVIGIPLSLTTYTFFPFWHRFFNVLGYKVRLSGKTNDEIKGAGIKMVAGEFCFPVKLAHGHVQWLLNQEGVDWIFLPHIISDEPNRFTTNSFFCAWVSGCPIAVKATLELNNQDTSRLLSPEIDFRHSEKGMLNELEKALGRKLNKTKRELRNARREAKEAQALLVEKCEVSGREAMARLEREGKTGIVIIGRPYNTFDTGANLSLPRKIADNGFVVFPMDFIPFRPENLGEEFENIFWSYGQRILNAVKVIKENPNLFCVYFSNFNCGPDSFLLSYVEHILSEKPFLALELDEHGGDTVYITRVEAFFDVIRNYSPGKQDTKIATIKTSNDEFKKRKMWIHHLHPIGARMFAAVFRSFGYNTEVLPPDNRKSFELGRSLTRGSECLPIQITIGSLIAKLREINADPREHAFLMPTSSGPCRFGQYVLLHRMILNSEGYEGLPILSPSYINAYQGLEEDMRRRLWLGTLISDILIKAILKIRPYELNSGDTDKAAEEAIQLMERALTGESDIERVFLKSMAMFTSIPRNDGPRPLVGIVGEIFIRANVFSNEDVIHAIEKFGGEAWLAPLCEWLLYTGWMDKWHIRDKEYGFMRYLKSIIKHKFLSMDEVRWYGLAGEFLSDRHEPNIADVIEEGMKYVPINVGTEAILTVGRTIHFIRQGAALVVNCSPFSCMPGTLSEAIFHRIQKETGLPVVNMFYDGEGGLNQRLEVFLNNLK